MERSIMAPAPFLTTDAYLSTPETVRPSEVVYGTLRVADAPTVRHQQAVCAFLLSLSPHVRQRRLGRVLLSPLDVVLDWDRALILQPDLVFVTPERWRIRQDKLVGAPDMVLEVMSPNPRIGDLHERLNWFAQYGVREVWLLHQFSERLEILAIDKGRLASRRVFDYVTPLRSSVLPEFTATVGDILTAAD
jgi:Uma2 family endonuclease